MYRFVPGHVPITGDRVTDDDRRRRRGIPIGLVTMQRKPERGSPTTIRYFEAKIRKAVA